jgi:hypothetical protein
MNSETRADAPVFVVRKDYSGGVSVQQFSSRDPQALPSDCVILPMRMLEKPEPAKKLSNRTTDAD